MSAGIHALLDLAAATIGWVAATTVLVSYGLMMSDRISSTGMTYLTANAVGSAGLALSMAVQHAWQSAVVNALWLAFGVAPLLRVLRRRPPLGWGCVARQATRILRSYAPPPTSAVRRTYSTTMR